MKKMIGYISRRTEDYLSKVIFIAKTKKEFKSMLPNVDCVKVKIEEVKNGKENNPSH